MTQRKLKLHDLIRIRWIDAFATTDSPWESSDDHPTDMHDVLTVGYYLQQTDRYIIVASTIADAIEQSQYGGVWRIPVGCILKVELM